MSQLRTIIIAGPSGVGKTFLSKEMILKYPNRFEHAPVYVTRPRRENEERIAIGRVFLSGSDYSRHQQNNEFLIEEYFAKNNYGYTAESFTPTNKNLLVDVSPNLLLKTLDFCINPVIILLQPSEEFLSSIEERLVSRGDSSQIIKDRRSYIKRDTDDINSFKMPHSVRGKTFIIKDDATIPNIVIPWIEAQLNLKICT